MRIGRGSSGASAGGSSPAMKWSTSGPSLSRWVGPGYDRLVRRALALTILALGTVACATGARWERPGGTDAERRRDEAGCAAQADRDRSLPTQRVTPLPGGGTVETTERVTARNVDPGVFDECMRTRGYERVPGRPPS
jgi:hypothetical protein